MGYRTRPQQEPSFTAHCPQARGLLGQCPGETVGMGAMKGRMEERG